MVDSASFDLVIVAAGSGVRMGGGNATKEMMGASIIVNDTWAFYQAKNIRQNEMRLAADQMKALRAGSPLMNKIGRAHV